MICEKVEQIISTEKKTQAIIEKAQNFRKELLFEQYLKLYENMPTPSKKL